MGIASRRLREQINEWGYIKSEGPKGLRILRNGICEAIIDDISNFSDEQLKRIFQFQEMQGREVEFV